MLRREMVGNVVKHTDRLVGCVGVSGDFSEIFNQIYNNSKLGVVLNALDVLTDNNFQAEETARGNEGHGSLVFTYE